MTATVQRFLEKVSVSDNIYKDSPCWNWTASMDGGGYGKIWINQKTILAHRYSYELYKGEITKPLQIDHLCRNRKCVNPIHLEIVTQQENLKRGLTGYHNKCKTHCPAGHEYTKKNTYRYPSKDHRRCNICSKNHHKKYSDKPESIARQKEYNQRPYVKARKKEYTLKPENIAKRKEYLKNIRLQKKKVSLEIK